MNWLGSFRVIGMGNKDTMDAITPCGQQTLILLFRRLCVRVGAGATYAGTTDWGKADSILSITDYREGVAGFLEENTWGEILSPYAVKSALFSFTQ